MYSESYLPRVHAMGVALTRSRKMSSRLGNMEMRNVRAGVQVLMNLSSREQRESAMGSKHRTREDFWNRPMWNGVIVRCWIGDEASEAIKRVRTDGSSQGIVPNLCLGFPRNSNLVIHGVIAATVSSVLLSHRLTSAGASRMCLKIFCWEWGVQALLTNEEDFRSRFDERLSIIWSISS